MKFGQQAGRAWRRRLLCAMVVWWGSGNMMAARIAAQTPEPPVWEVGDWWILSSQMYETVRIVPETESRWLPPQSWHFRVEGRELLEDQPYFVVAVQPQEDNPSPYRFRFWFRETDRYVGRYELIHPEPSAGKRVRSLGAGAVRKDFDPGRRLPFLTSKLPALPLTLPLFAEVPAIEARGVRERSARSAPMPYVGPEFELSQEIRTVDASAVAEKAPADAHIFGAATAGPTVLITIRAATGVVEEQYWQPQFPWCVYGQRQEQDVVTRRYWLVETGRD